MKDAKLDREHAERGDLFCAHCDKPLKVGRVEWLELNCQTSEWAEPGTADWSDGPDSQGMYPVGSTCAKRLLGL